MDIIKIYLSEVLNGLQGTEIAYAILIFALFVLPRLFLRFGLPMALTAFFMGAGANAGFGFNDRDNVVSIFASLGIIALFLFAGMEVDLNSLKGHFRRVTEHVIVRFIVVGIFGAVISIQYTLAVPTSILVALAIATPSTGFILDSLEHSSLNEDKKYWIKLKAISAELVALGMLLVVTKSGDAAALAGSLTVIITLILVLPYLFKRIVGAIERIAPGSEFTFLLILAVIFGLITKKLGAYYLVGAFIVGIMAGRYRRETPNLTTEEMLKSLRMFAAFFMPFYFFNAGLKFPLTALGLKSLTIAGFLIAVSFPIKIFSIMLHRKISLNEGWRDSAPIALSLMPNLVFGLVLAELMNAMQQIPVEIYGGLIIYTLLTTMVAPLILKVIHAPDDVRRLSGEDKIMDQRQ
ncbi:MAG: cation:proton antiporter [Turneriella sp.]|nr:cation:proton antiporter [Turneriella sp.]